MADDRLVFVGDGDAPIIIDRDSGEATAPTPTHRSRRPRVQTPSAVPTPSKRARRAGPIEAPLHFLRCCLCKYEAYTTKPMQTHYERKHGVSVLLDELEGPRAALQTMIADRLPEEIATGSEAESDEAEGSDLNVSVVLTRLKPGIVTTPSLSPPSNSSMKRRPMRKKKTVRVIKKSPQMVRRPLPRRRRRHLPRWANYLKSGSFELRRKCRMTRQYASTFRLSVPEKKLYFRCLLCPVGEYSTSAMRSHYRKSHAVDFQAAPLPKSLDELEEKGREPNKRRFVCASCSVKFESNAQLVSHLASQHVPPAFMRYRCKCGERFVLQSEYQEHVRKGHGKHSG